MELCVLGPLEARVDGTALPLGTRKQQAVLALLAVRANQTVGIDEFVDELWHRQSPPPSAVSNVRLYAGNLRRLFQASEDLPDRIGRRGAGFALRAEPDELDLLAFDRDCRAAAAGTDPASAATLLTDATARWRGQMLAGLHRGPILAARCAGVEAQRLAVIEQLAEIHLTLGEPHRATAAMSEHVHAHRLRERAHEILIRALHESGDSAAALSAYRTARTILAEELGIEPGAELQRIHRAILSREPTRRPSTVAVVPRELPAGIGYFVGRREEARRVADALVRPEHRRPALAILCGTGGVGKSALAVHVAHKIKNSYPDGQIYIDLRGSTPGLRPLTPVEALRHILRGLGTPKDQIPDDETGAGSRLRSATADGGYLFLLDNATGPAQVRPLLPAGDACAVIITSRHPLATIDADVHLNLDTLPVADGLNLLRHASGGTPIDSEIGQTIAELCGHLPLALRIAGGRLLSRPDLAPAELAGRLADRGRRLDELVLEGVAVRSCIRVGYEALTSGTTRVDLLATRAFTALGLLNVPDVRPAVMAAMLSEPEADVAGALDHLVSAQLLSAAAGNYRMHDLVRLVAAETAAENHDPATGVRMLRRAMAYYAATAHRASEILRPGRAPMSARFTTPPDVRVTDLGSRSHATAWLDIELPNIIAAIEQANTLERDGDDGHLTLWLTSSIHQILWERSESGLRHRMATLALDAERQYPDDHGTAGWAHLLLGQAEFDLGNRDQATEHFDQGLRMLRRADDPKGVALALNSLAIAAAARPEGRKLAIDRFVECLEHVRLHGLTSQEATILANLGNLRAWLGRWGDARRDVEESLSMSRARGDAQMTGSNLGLLAAVYCALDDLSAAAEHARLAIAACREVGDGRRECHALLVAAEVHLRGGDADGALRQAEEALSTARARRYAYAEAAALRLCARASAATGRHDRAVELRSEAEAAFATLSTPADPVLESVLGP